jgi:hypothetical protein
MMRLLTQSFLLDFVHRLIFYEAQPLSIDLSKGSNRQGDFLT